MIGTECVELAGVAQGALLVERAGLRLNANAAQLRRIAKRRDAELAQKLLRQRSGGDAHSRLSRAGPFEHATDRTEVFDGAGQVSVARPRTLQVSQAFELAVSVDDFQGDRAAQRVSLPDSAFDFDRVGFDALSAAPAIAPLPPPQLCIDRIGFDGHSGWKAVDQGPQRLAM